MTFLEGFWFYWEFAWIMGSGAAFLYLISERVLAPAADEMADALNVGSVIKGNLFQGGPSSAGEIATGISGAMNGSPEISVGCILGSAIVNIGAISWAMTRHGAIKIKDRFGVLASGVIYIAMVVLLGLTVYAAPAVEIDIDGVKTFVQQIPWWVGWVMVSLYSPAYLLFLWIIDLIKSKNEEAERRPIDWGKCAKSIPLMAFGGFAVFVGCDVMMKATIEVCHVTHFPGEIAGLVLNAPITSIADGVVSYISAGKGDGDAGLTNVFGSNLLDILWGLGWPVVITGGIAVSWMALWPLFVATLLFSLLMLYFVYTHDTFERWEGNVLGGMYAAFFVGMVSWGVFKAKGVA